MAQLAFISALALVVQAAGAGPSFCGIQKDGLRCNIPNPNTCVPFYMDLSCKTAGAVIGSIEYASYGNGTLPSSILSLFLR